MAIRTIVACGVLLFSAVVSADENLLANGGFEDGAKEWQRFWSRTGHGESAIDADIFHAGKIALRIEHPGPKDWSFQRIRELEVTPGQIYQLTGWARIRGEGTATLCVTLRDGDGQVVDWSYGGRTVRAGDDWQQIRCRFVIPKNGRAMLPRFIGHGPATVWLDDVQLLQTGDIAALRAKDLPQRLTVANAAIEATLHVGQASLEIRDRRSGHRWRQRPAAVVTPLAVARSGQGFSLKLLHAPSMLILDVDVKLIEDRPELTVHISATGELSNRIAYPPPLETESGMTLVMPVNEGIGYPVDDDALRPMHYHLYGGHGLCMGWYGITVDDGETGVMTIVETPDDAGVRVPRLDGRLTVAPEWQPQKGRFGYSRSMRYVLFDRGGYVAMCKRYRQVAQEAGRLKTFVQKRITHPNVDKLIGAVNVWCWDRDAVAICRELQEAGIERILWSNRGDPQTVRQLNEIGALTSRYDIYQDAMDPANFPRLRHVHADWTADGWPHDIARGPTGDWLRGWRVMGKDDQWYPCGVLCDRRAVDYARRRIPADLETHPYRCRFIDTTTAAPWRECYHADHPMTRTESKRWKMELLKFVSDECGLICGSETGHEAAVPYVHYFEGMMSLGPYRIPDAGRKMRVIWDEVPERVARFQTGHYYRLPLWELVYHDCVVAQWYWGDYNNKLPRLWDRRDLWNALYGTAPMFMFDRQLWHEQRDRFVKSYSTATEVARATGYSEMVSHRWLTADHAVQQTRFANGVTVTVNFGDTPYKLPDETTLGPMSRRVTGVEERK